MSVLSNPSLGAAHKSALAATVMAWAIPKDYGFLCPILLMVATLYPHIRSGRINRLTSATITLFSAISIPLLTLSLSSFLLTYPYLPQTLNEPLPFFGYALWLNLAPMPVYPIITIASFVMAALSLLYIIIKRITKNFLMVIF